MAAETIEQRIIETGGKTTGFDCLRITLATLIVAWHTIPICYGSAFEHTFVTGWPRPFRAIVLPMFFALSGFLVAGSLERCKTLISFLGLRALRLLPALIVESVIAIFVIGFLFTSLPKFEYLHNRHTWTYLLNIVGDIHYLLPGVFTGLPTTFVNSQLWTLPFEMGSYAAISVIVVFFSYKTKWRLLLWVALAQVAIIALAVLKPEEDTGAMTGRELILAFLYGIAIFRFREQVPLSRVWLAASAVATIGLLSFNVTFPIAALPAAYLTVALGLTNPRVPTWLSKNDFSYPIFLYGFPLQQATYALLPWSRTWWLNFIVSMVPILIIAWMSWNWVERPTGKRVRPWIYKGETAIMRRLHLTAQFGLGLLPPGMRPRWASADRKA
ncbi:MAG TPA: acyltransferase [Rhizomicrobium sp.]|jgi:peptidoglycan/LPS O-acetylase OafA/YrhL|nr:acyltransferase [Rhizomicrobium sp.]